MSELVIVSKVRTVVTLEDLVPCFARSLERLTGAPCEVVDGAMIYGKLVSECGHPGPTQCCWRLNVGNIRGRSKAGRACVLEGAYEIVKAGAVPKGWHVVPTPKGASVPAGSVAVLPDNPGKHQLFRAYLELQEATDEYVEVLGADFPGTLREVMKIGSSPEALVDTMKAERYFTGDVTAYRHNVAWNARKAAPRVAEILAELAPANRNAVGSMEILGTFETYAATAFGLRAGEGEHAVKPEPAPDFTTPTILDRVKRFFGGR